MSKLGEIRVKNNATGIEIDIEGVIGVPEWWQFDRPEDKVATYDKFKDVVGSIRDSGASEVTVNIRSIGGNVNDALLIYDTLIALGATVTTRCYGYVASAATVIAQAASEGLRMVSDNSLYLIHQSASTAEGNASEIASLLNLLQKTDERLANIYATRSGKPAEDFSRLMAENNGSGIWLSPNEVIEAGLADKIISGGAISNFADNNLSVMNLPKIPEDKQLNIKQETMKVKNTWLAILNFFGFDAEKENELTEAQIEKINNELGAKIAEVTNLTKVIDANKTALDNKDAEITALKNKVADLESAAAKAKAGPTETEPKEDPAPQDMTKKSPRVEAYEEDVKNFKN